MSQSVTNGIVSRCGFPNRNEYQGYLLRGKGARCVGLTLPPSCADCLKILEPSTSWSPKGLSRPLKGHLYLLQAPFCILVCPLYICQASQRELWVNVSNSGAPFSGHSTSCCKMWTGGWRRAHLATPALSSRSMNNIYRHTDPTAPSNTYLTMEALHYSETCEHLPDYTVS